MKRHPTIKICGITTVDDALLAVRAGADYLGLIRADGPRRVSLEDAARIARSVPRQTQTVLLFKDASAEQVLEESAAVRPDHIQLHGREPAELLLTLHAVRPLTGLIKVWELPAAATDSAHSHDPLSIADGIRDYVRSLQSAPLVLHALLLDVPKGGAHPGFAAMGGVARLLADSISLPIWCAGGLTPTNVREALDQGPFAGVDVARGVESAPGRKDAQAVQRFVRAVRGFHDDA